MDILQTLGDWPVAAGLRRSSLAYLLVNAGHILAIGVLVGAIVTLDLRLLGLFRAAPVAILGPPLVKVAAAGLALAVVTGFLLFSVRPVSYASNPAFLSKLALVALGVLNAAMLHLGGPWRRAFHGPAIPAAVKVAAALSLIFWAGAVVAGRWIGFL
jgi:hypothetical protein